MILEFGAKNAYSFKEGFVVNMRLDGNCPIDVSQGKNYTNILSIKGANASGKTSVLKVLSFIEYFALRSFGLDIGEELPVDTYFDNDNSIHFYLIFLENKIEYKYEVELTKMKILSETIYENNVKVIERTNNKFITLEDHYAELKIMKLRDNVSILSTGRQYDLESIAVFLNFFDRIITNVKNDGMTTEFMDYKVASELYNKDKFLLDFVKKVLIKSDTGIQDISIHKRKDEETDKIRYYPIFKFKINGKIKQLTYHDQSSGVRSLFKQLGAYRVILNEGGVLALDEFDINLHPDLLPLLICFFSEKETNPNDAQLIFTTHNNEIMDKLKKYRIILVNKEDNESFLYRLDDVKSELIRNDRGISSLYSSGKLGGKPLVELCNG